MFQNEFSTSEYMMQPAAFNMSKAEQEIKDATGLQEIESLFPPSTPTTPVVNNISMKLPAFWPDTAEVWFAQAEAQFAI